MGTHPKAVIIFQHNISMIDLIKPYLGEDAFSALKRKVYFIRDVKRRIDYHREDLLKKTEQLVPLTQAEIKVIDQFWAKYLSSRLKDEFLDYRYYEFYKSVLKSGERLCEYMPDDFYEGFIDEFFTNPQHSRPFDDKNIYDLFFHDVNRPKTIFRKIRNLYLDSDYRVITLNQALKKARDHGEVILKISKFSEGGRGIMFWNALEDKESELLNYLNQSNDVICQDVIKQHTELGRLNSSSVNTIRVMTLMFGNKAHVLSSVLRMGINGSRVDNASSGGIVVGIGPDGRLKNRAFDVSGKEYLRHPQGAMFETVTIPGYNHCVEQAASLAYRFSSVSRMISWDYAIEETGQPILIEFNLSWGQLDFHQLCNGPIFGDLTDDVLKEVFQKSYTLKSIIESFKNQ